MSEVSLPNGSSFAAWGALAASQGAAAVLARAAEELRAAERWHELFDVRLIEGRLGAGLPAILPGPLEALPEPQRLQVEEIYLAACQEVGQALLTAHRFREAWLYLRPTGHRESMRSALEAWHPNEDQVSEAIELGAHHGLAPPWGVEVALAHYGTCNSISLIDGCLAGWLAADRQAAIGRLVSHLHAELVANVRHHIAEQTGVAPETGTLGEWTAAHDWLTANDNYHVDTSHLSSTVRLARLVEQPATLELACDLTAYGARLSPMYHFQAEEPFADLYASHGLFFGAQLGQRVDEAVEYFEVRARTAEAQAAGSLPAESLVCLLSRLGRWEAALEASSRWLPPGTAVSGFAPTLLELGQRSGRYAQVESICAARGDLVGFLAALAARLGAGAS